MVQTAAEILCAMKINIIRYQINRERNESGNRIWEDP